MNENTLKPMKLNSKKKEAKLPLWNSSIFLRKPHSVNGFVIGSPVKTGQAVQQEFHCWLCKPNEILAVSRWAFFYCFFTGQVEMPKIAYNGQKLIILVKVNTPDNTSKIIPTVPPTTFVK